ncbi:MAG: FmdB family zinc ribbon protein [Betaproteobacteria bacterium]
MPIYAYKCDACGFAKDVLQKMSDDTLTDCPSCGKAEFKKQVTAAGFQLKGSGWYVTDFRGDKNAPATAVPPAAGGASESTASDAAAPAPAAAPAAAAPAAASTPAASGPSAAPAAT